MLQRQNTDETALQSITITDQVLFLELTFHQTHTSVLSHILQVNYIFPIWVTEPDNTLISYVKTVIKRFQKIVKIPNIKFSYAKFGVKKHAGRYDLIAIVHLITLCK
jgi:hypothetical protein